MFTNNNKLTRHLCIETVEKCNLDNFTIMSYLTLLLKEARNQLVDESRKYLYFSRILLKCFKCKRVVSRYYCIDL